MKRLSMFSLLASISTVCVLATVGHGDVLNAKLLGEETGVSSGLCVMVGCSDTATAAALAAPGRLLVHALETDEGKTEAMRRHLHSRGVYGLASCETMKTPGRLPYAENLVNLILVDNDALGDDAPSAQEIDRVLVPNGVARVKSNGIWSSRSKPMPPGMDEWPMHNHGPDGNPVSSDTLVGVPTSIKWLAWYGHYGNNGEGLHGPAYYEIRAGGGRVFQHFRFKNAQFNIEQYPIDARDAFNGIAQWQIKPSFSKWSRGFCPLLVAGDRFFTVIESDGPLVELDAGAGKAVRSFDNAGTLGSLQQSIYPVWFDGTIIQVAGNRLVRFNPDNGTIHWEYNEGDVALALPAVASEKNKVFVAVGLTDEGLGAGQSGGGRRFPRISCDAVACLDLSTGLRIWRTELPPPLNRITQLVYADGVLGVYGAYSATVGPEDSARSLMAAIDPDNGKWLWRGDARMGLADKWSSAGNAPMYLAVRDGHFFNLFKQKYYEMDAGTGERIQDVILNVPNNRCLRPFMTTNYAVMGFGIYVKKSLDWCFTNISRSTCGSMGFPAYGQLYTGPDGECTCFQRIRCATALSCEELEPDIPDDMRLERGTVNAPSTRHGSVVQASSFPDGGFFPSRKPVITDKPILDDWHNNDYLPVKETAPVSLDGRTFVGVVNEHRLECREGERVTWEFTAGGRISNPPLLRHGMCIFGSHDGYVYALRQSDGALVWRFLAARTRRRICAFSQLESSHPVFGVVSHGDNVYFSAGRHPEVDGGIYVWGLNPVSGEIAGKSVFRTDHPWAPRGSNSYSAFKNKVVNGVLTTTDGTVKLSGVDIDSYRTSVSVLSEPGAREATVTKGRFGYEVRFGAGGGVAELYTPSGRRVMMHRQITGARALIPLTMISRGKHVLVIRKPQ